MKANKGFTLIELLAVIVILAIIALIATPIIVELIKNARISSSENATNGILKAAEVYYGNVVLENQGVFFENTTQTIEFGTEAADVIEYDGTGATGGKITIDRDGVITIVEALKVNNYFCAYTTTSSDKNRTVKCVEEADKDDDIITGEDW